MDIRKDGGRIELDALWAQVSLLTYLALFGAMDAAGIANGLTAGKLKTAAAADYKINGLTYTKAATDDLWDLSAEVATTADELRAYWLYLDAAGTATIAAGATVGTAAAPGTVALAKLALPALDTTKSVMGVYIAGNSTNFAAALAAQGTIVDGVPVGVPGAPDVADIVNLVAF